MLRSFKLRFVHRHVRIEIVGTDAGVDLSGEDADAAFALAGPLLAAIGEQAPAATVRALSVDPDQPLLLASLDPPGAARLEGDSLRPALEAAAPLLAWLEDRAQASVHRREVAVRASPSPAQTDESSLVLTAVGVPHRVEGPAQPGAPVTVLAPRQEADAARAALAAFEEENAPKAALAAPPEYGPTLIGLVFALLVLATHAAARFVPAALLERGTSDAEEILGGEWWRTVTALALHADAAHAGSNALIGAIAIALLAQRVGPAAAASLTLLSGALANGLTALVYRSDHVAIGVSGSVFGALGALTAAQLTLGQGSRRGRPWLAVAAGAALLGFLGSSKGSDLFAHAFGMLAGGLLGGIIARLLRDPPRRRALQPALAAITVLAAAACWWPALRR